MTSLSNGFNYSVLDTQTSEFLKSKEKSMSEIVGKAYTELGRELKEAQDELAKRGYGCFYEWFESLGFKKDQVYRWIGRYELIVANCDKRELIEELPVSLAYEISKPSTSTEIKQKVLDGEIASLKELREVKKALQEAERRAAQAEATAETERNSARHFEKLFNSVKNQPPRIETKTIEVVPTRVQQELESLRNRLDAAEKLKAMYEKDSNEYKELKSKIEFLNREKNDLHRQIESATALSGLAVKIDHFLKTELSPIRYSRALERLDSEVAAKNLTDILNSVEHWLQDMRSYLPQHNRKVVYDYDPTG